MLFQRKTKHARVWGWGGGVFRALVSSRQCIFFFSFLFFFWGASIHSIWNFLGQGSNPSHSCDLRHGCSNAGSLTHCAGLGIECTPLQRQCRIFNQLHHSRIPRGSAFFLFKLFDVLGKNIRPSWTLSYLFYDLSLFI